jgi:predicted XRE-type DNA-binding protein
MRAIDPEVRLRIVRLAAEELPQRLVAERLGVSQPFVSNVERAAGLGRRLRRDQRGEVGT